MGKPHETHKKHTGCQVSEGCKVAAPEARGALRDKPHEKQRQMQTQLRRHLIHDHNINIGLQWLAAYRLILTGLTQFFRMCLPLMAMHAAAAMRVPLLAISLQEIRS